MLYREVADGYGYSGSDTSFVRHLRELRPLEIRDAEIRFETDASVQTQGDWVRPGSSAATTAPLFIAAAIRDWSQPRHVETRYIDLAVASTTPGGR